MNILIVSEMSVPYAVGGGEVRYSLLARELARRGHQVTWLSMRQRDCPDEESAEGVRHLHRGPRIRDPASRPTLALIRFMFTVFGHVLTHRYDVIDSQTYAPLPPAWLACLLSRQRIVATIHSTIYDVPRDEANSRLLRKVFHRLGRFAEKIIYSLPYARIIAVSNSTADALVRHWGVSERRIVVIPNGIDMPPDDDRASSTERWIDLIYAGRFVDIKNIQDLIRVVSACVSAGVAKKAVLIGEGPLLPAMIQRAESAGLSDVIEFKGRRSNAEVIDLMRHAKVYFHASSLEGFPVVMVEAMACRLPVVAYRIPGVTDLVEHGRSGLLVNYRDTVALSEACIHLLRSHERRAAMAAAARHAVAGTLTLASMTDRVMLAYVEGGRLR